MYLFRKMTLFSKKDTALKAKFMSKVPLPDPGAPGLWDEAIDMAARTEDQELMRALFSIHDQVDASYSTAYSHHLFRLLKAKPCFLLKEADSKGLDHPDVSSKLAKLNDAFSGVGIHLSVSKEKDSVF